METIFPFLRKLQVSNFNYRTPRLLASEVLPSTLPRQDLYLIYFEGNEAVANRVVGAGGDAGVDNGGAHRAGLVLAVGVRDLHLHHVAGEVEHPDADGDERNPVVRDDNHHLRLFLDFA